MKKPKTKRAPDTDQVKHLKHEIKKQVDELCDRWDKILALEDRNRALELRITHLEGKLGPVAKLVDAHPPIDGDDEIDEELIDLRRLIAILEDIAPGQRRRLLAMVDGRYYDMMTVAK